VVVRRRSVQRLFLLKQGRERGISLLRSLLSTSEDADMYIRFGSFGLVQQSA
jgi:hypothetical protein